MRFIIFMLSFIHCVTASHIYLNDEDVPFEWHPAHGLFIKNFGVLRNIRLNGCFGGKDYPGARADWRQSTFEGDGVNDPQRRLENSLSYPLEPIAAFIQWCYPSPGRTMLERNNNCRDPLGIWAQDMANADCNVKAKAQQVMGDVMHLINGLYQSNNFDDAAKENFSREFKRLFNPNAMKEKYINAFTDIVFEAVKGDLQDADLQSLYPKNIVQRALIAYITDIVNDPEDLLTIYKNAQLIDANYKLKPPELMTMESYNELKKRLTQESGSISDYTRYLYGQQRFESKLPEEISTKRAIFELNDTNFGFANCGEVATLNFFLTFIWHEGAIHPEWLEHLNNYPHIKTIRSYFEKFSTLEILQTQNAHSEWAKLLANKNIGLDNQSSQRVTYKRQDKYKQNIAELSGATLSITNLFDILFTKDPSTINDNQQLSIDHTVDLNRWETKDLSSAADKELTLKKWARTCSLLKHPSSPRSIVMADASEQKIGLQSQFKFILNDKCNFEFSILKSHFALRQSFYDSDNVNLRYPDKLVADQVFSNYFKSGYKPPTGRLFIDMINEYNISSCKLIKDNILSDKRLGHLNRSIFFRTLNTFAHQRYDDDYVIEALTHALYEACHLSPQDIINTTMTIPAGHDFWLSFYLPNTFYSINGYTEYVIKYLQDNKLYKNYVDNLMNKQYSNQYQFAAYHNSDVHFNKLKQRLKDPKHPGYIAAKSTFQGPLIESHPLISAVRGNQLNIIKKITNNGKAAYWKVDRATGGEDRLIYKAMEKPTKAVLEFLFEHNPELFEFNDESFVPQFILRKAMDGEVFDYLVDKLNLSEADLTNWHHPDNGKNMSILNVALWDLNYNMLPFISHVLTKYPTMPVTDHTISSLLNNMYHCHETTYDSAKLLLDRYQGDFEFLNYHAFDRPENSTYLENLVTDNPKVWFFDLIAPRLPKDLQINGQSVLLKTPYDYKPYVLWNLIKSGFSLDLVDASGKDVKELLRVYSNSNLILWMLNHDTRRKPTQDEIENLKSRAEETFGYYDNLIDRQLFYKDFMQDFSNLETRLGYQQDSQTTVH